MFKLDTEGSEWSILRAVPESIRSAAQAYIGELHGLHDWQICDLLSQTHAVGVSKPVDRNCFPFVALRKDLVRRLRAAA